MLDYQARLALARDVLDRDLESDADYNRYCIRLNPLHELSYVRETIKELQTLAGRAQKLEQALIRRNKGDLRRARSDARQWSNTMTRQQQYNDDPRIIRISAGRAREFAIEADKYRRNIVRIDLKEDGLQRQIAEMVVKLKAIEGYLLARREDIVTLRQDCMDWKWDRIEKELY